ncbi:MAG: NYN domain-containing protein [Candidatus Omnitrophica bacterium]|nr:NYN domain-containing protein [Candidatus Omnitrophota bacterium]MBU4149498.1 NYN domain-containing protein [Candidatus Omnitrophota bacterium]
MPRYLIIDGYNAIHKIDELEAKKDISLEAARLYFIKLLNDFMRRKNTFDKICIVFDSKEEALGVRRYSHGRVEALFATRDKDADSAIVDLLRKASPGDKISVASDDNFVKNHARVYSRDVISIKELENIIMLKRQSFKSKIREKGLGRDDIKDINTELKKRWGIE